ncbi:DUF4307 domain-containing protein [Flaviflexus salsibiostraticola]|uniref:DUF4307 domain-containing protein n=1 Tax=Flaviflexus salsibiostraticola TaxID=1282737 RepID=A0A3S8ZB50_9ACTO|nr:DUF4307 domain-containing protein [Flaviflexus salsibiostraticola]AZN30707.1 DUF4307 domain-containing protein [Flaviflexus salsibiostraticola]
MTDIPPELRDRYGLDRHPSRRIGYLLVALAVLIAAIIGASQLIGRDPTIQLVNTGHTPVSDSEVRITYTVHGREGLELECSATAVNDNFAQIGAKTWTWTMEEDSVSDVLMLQTSERAAAGSIEYCAVVK